MSTTEERQTERFGKGYIHEDEPVDGLMKWGFPYLDKATPAAEVESTRREFIRDHNEAVGVYLDFIARFQACGGVREEISKVRADLRLEERLLTLTHRFLHMSKGKMDFANSIIRAEAMAAHRDGEAMRAEREQILAEQKAREQAEMAADERFGMF